MLLITRTPPDIETPQYLANTGISTMLTDRHKAMAWWVLYQKDKVAPDVPADEIGGVWLADDSEDSAQVIACGGRVTINSDLSLSFTLPPPPLPRLDPMYEHLGALKNRKDGQSLAGDTEAAAATQLEIDAAQAQIEEAKAIIAAAAQ